MSKKREEGETSAQNGGGRARGRGQRAAVKKSMLEKRVCGAAGAAGCVVVYRRNRVARYGTPRSLAARSRCRREGCHDTLFDIRSHTDVYTLNVCGRFTESPRASSTGGREGAKDGIE